MNKFLIVFLSFIFTSCSANETLINPIKSELEVITFDVVEKKLHVEKNLPENAEKLLTKWFNDKVKINGFDGQLIFTIIDYSQNIISIIDGKKVEISLNFNLVLTKPTMSQTKFIEGTVSSYGTLSGTFSLNDFDTIIENTQKDLILRLSRDLQSKI
tara:strand:+ start:1649 stop:2119 length:471 start_codon:yes stop_codon:yes gene_type:complete